MRHCFHLALILAFVSVVRSQEVPPSPAAATAAPVFPIKASANKRYLVDQNNVPFLITGDSPQALIGNVSLADAEIFLANRKAAGFNTLWINLVCNNYTGCFADGSTYDLIRPFTDRDDISTINEAYFARADAMLSLARQYGFLVILDPIETGGFMPVLRTSGLAKARVYGRFVGNRYKNFDNIIWMSGNDFTDWTTPSDDALAREVALGIKEVDTRHIHTIELNAIHSASLYDPTWAPIISLDAAYTLYPTYILVLQEYNRANFAPIFLVEANYEFEQNFRDLGTPFVLRHQEYWSLLSGAAAGHLYGNLYTWQFLPDWRTKMDTPGSKQTAYVKDLFEPRKWYNLVPDQEHTVLTAGFGLNDDSVRITDNTYATAARTPDGSLVVAYLPTLRTVTIDLSKLSNTVNARWYDPSNGTYTSIAGSPFIQQHGQQGIHAAGK